VGGFGVDPALFGVPGRVGRFCCVVRAGQPIVGGAPCKLVL